MSNFDKNFEAARLAMLAKQHSDIGKRSTNLAITHKSSAT